MFNVRTLSLILAIIMVFGLASLAFAQPGLQAATTATTTAAAGAAATATRAAAAPTTLPTTGGGVTATASWMLPFLAFVVLFLVAGLGLNLARRAQ